MIIAPSRRNFLPGSPSRLAALALAGLCVNPAADLAAATIALQQDAVTSVIARRLFANEGKRMLSGTVETCSYAYLEQPAVTLRDGRLFLRVHLVGQAGLKVSGKCMGAGDALYTTVSGQPYINGESIGLKDFRVDEGKTAYRALLEPFLNRQIPSLLGVNLREELAKVFQNNQYDLKITLPQFQLIDVKARDGLLTVSFDFALQAHKR